jgi:hypothetical protein
MNDSKEASFMVYGPKTMLQKTRPDEIKVEMVLGERGEEEPQVTLPSNLRDSSQIRSIKLTSKPTKP